MSCIVAIAEGKRVLLAADSMSLNGWTVRRSAESKVFRVGEAIVGHVGSSRIGPVTRYALKAPPLSPPKAKPDLLGYVYELAEEVRKLARSVEYSTSDTLAYELVVGLRGRIFRIGADHGAGESLGGYEAVGSGCDAALGALHVTKRDKLTPMHRAKLALNAAAAHNMGVRPPFTFLWTEMRKR